MNYYKNNKKKESNDIICDKRNDIYIKYIPTVTSSINVIDL